MNGLRVRIGNSNFYFSPNLRTERATEIQANSISAHVLRDKKTDCETYLWKCRKSSFPSKNSRNEPTAANEHLFIIFHLLLTLFDSSLSKFIVD